MPAWLRTLERKFQSEGYGLFLCNSEEDPAIEEFYINNLLDNRVEAIILTPATRSLSPRLISSGVPVVLADREIELPEGPFATVTSDNYRGGQLVARNLAEKRRPQGTCSRGQQRGGIKFPRSAAGRF